MPLGYKRVEPCKNCNHVIKMDEKDQSSRPAPLPYRLLAGALAAWAAWYLMLASHESGHIIAALLTGGRIDHVDLSPIGLSQTHLSHNPWPLLVVWAGPVVGILDPLLAWLLAVWMRRRDQTLDVDKLITFIAGLCLIANGVYLGLGWIDLVGDTGEMMRLGTPTFVMISFGVTSTALGLLLWHRLGTGMGLAAITQPNANRLIVWSAGILAFGVALSFVLS